MTSFQGHALTMSSGLDVSPTRGFDGFFVVGRSVWVGQPQILSLGPWY